MTNKIHTFDIETRDTIKLAHNYLLQAQNGDTMTMERLRQSFLKLTNSDFDAIDEYDYMKEKLKIFNELGD